MHQDIETEVQQSDFTRFIMVRAFYKVFVLFFNQLGFN